MEVGEALVTEKGEIELRMEAHRVAERGAVVAAATGIVLEV